MKRSFLFLQGPHGPFFAMLGHEMRARGHKVLRVNFNGGDWYDWKGGGESVDFSGALSDWADFCRDLLCQRRITDLIIYGDCRPLHRQAIEMAERCDVRVHVFEEGYIRPDWVTLEQGGVNANSSLPRNAEWYLRKSRRLPSIPHVPVGPSLRPQIRHCIKYYLASMLLKPLFPAYRTHRQIHPVREGWYWLRRFPRFRLEQKRSRKVEEELLATGKPYFLVALQISVDSQITCHSPFRKMEDFIAKVLESFAQQAPEGVSLLFKGHPLDHGGVDYRAFIAEKSEALGIGDRCRYLESGQLPELIKGSKGVVLVNSTVGTSVLHHRRPLIALGESIYNFEGLTFQGSLDAFWSDPTRPDQEVSRAFRRYLFNKVLFNGGFYNPEARERLLATVVPQIVGTRRISDVEFPAVRETATPPGFHVWDGHKGSAARARSNEAGIWNSAVL